MYSLSVDPDVTANFPQAHVMVLYASGFTNAPSNDESKAMQQETIQDLLTNFPYEKTSEHPHIAGWRSVFSAFGAKPKKYHCSAESLIKRALKAESLPQINYLVDMYNCLSIQHVIPFGGEDRDALTSDIVLTFAKGDEKFISFSGENEPPEPGEVIWLGEDGECVCRRWNWRQGAKTVMTENTTNGYFVIECAEPYTMNDAQAAADDLEKHLKMMSPGVSVECEILSN